MTTPRQGVFISYARADGEALARDLYARLQAEGLPLWRDLDRLEGGRDWWLQIASALDQCEFMVLVMTAASMDSLLVRKEWRYARQRGVCVYPVKGTSSLDFEALPHWMRSVHFYDLDREWLKLVSDLRTRCQRPRVPFMAEDLPPEFVARPAEYQQLLSHLLDRTREEPVAITTAIRAAGGFGKTVLARALCHDEDVQNAFDDGILWITLGENPGDLTGRVEDLIYFLSGRRPGFSSVEAATAMFVELLADRDILLVIDDVWDSAHLKPFIQGGSHCARVITTRVVDTLPTGTLRVDVDVMRRSEAIALLGFGLPAGFDEPLSDLAERLGEWPLLLTLANAALQDRVRDGRQSVVDAIAYVNKALLKKGVTFFDARDASARHQAVAKTIEISIERLTEGERQRFGELAVFPEDAKIPLSTLEKYWGRTGALDELDTETLCERLSRLSLVLVFEPTQRYIRLHDVIRRFLMQRVGSDLARLHAELLSAHRPQTQAWADMSAAEPYLWQHLADHLVAAGLGAQLIETALDSRYLTMKAFASGALAVEPDLRAAEHEAKSNPTLRSLRQSFVQSSHLLNRSRSVEEVRATFLSRIQHVTELSTIADTLSRSMTPPYLRALHPLPDLPHPALIRTFSAGGSTLWGCALSPDASLAVSAGYDGTLRVWDTATGAESLQISGHASWVRRCAVSPNGAFIVSASFDRRLRVWDASNGELLRELADHTDGVTDCKISPDSRLIVSTSLDETIRVWDAETGEVIRTLRAEWKDERGGWLVRSTSTGHVASVWSCAISPDGKYLLSASADQTMKLWRLDTGDEVRTFVGHNAAVQACAFSPDGLLVASASGDGIVSIWDRTSGTLRQVIDAQAGAVSACTFSPDGTLLVFACADGTVRAHDVQSGARRRIFSGHTDVVNDCAISKDGFQIASASMDGTVKLWDTTALDTGSATRERDWINACAISSDEDLIVTASSQMHVQVWNARQAGTPTLLIGHTGSIRGCTIVAGSNYIVSASSDKTLRVWDATTGRMIATLTGHRDWVNACDASRDTRLLVSGSSDKTLRIWDTRTWSRRLTIVAHGDSVNACRFSPDGRRIASASSDGTVKLWDVATLRDAWESPTVAEGRRSLEEVERQLAPIVLAADERSVNDCAFFPDGSRVVSASSDRSIRIWDAESGALRRTLFGHERDVYGCAVNPEGTLIASVSTDQSIKIWDSESGECLTTLHVDGVLTQCAWFANGTRLLAVGVGGLYALEFRNLVGR